MCIVQQHLIFTYIILWFFFCQDYCRSLPIRPETTYLKYILVTYKECPFMVKPGWWHAHMYKHASRLKHTPKRPVDFARRFHNTLLALRAYPSYTGSPSSRLRRPNSSTKDPAPAVQVSADGDRGKPWRKFTCRRSNLQNYDDIISCFIYMIESTKWLMAGGRTV